MQPPLCREGPSQSGGRFGASSSGSLLLLLLVLLLWGNHAVAADREKTDVVVMRNGDHITGEIVSLEFGILRVKTSNMGTLSIEWPAIASVASQYDFFVERIGGSRYYGKIVADGQGRFTVKADDAGADDMAVLDVMRLSQIESGFWERINGTLSVGYNFTKSSDISISSVNFNGSYRSEKIESSLTISTLSTKSPDSGTTDRDQIANSTRFLRPGKNYWVALSSLERNEELGIEGRLQLGAAVGRHFLQKPIYEITGIVGLSFNQEWITGQEGGQQSVEGVLGADWRIFKFSDPETALTSSINVYPSITESGRWRSELNLVLTRELFDDFTLDLTYYNSYDSDPPDATAAGSDYGIVTGFGYKF